MTRDRIRTLGRVRLGRFRRQTPHGICSPRLCKASNLCANLWVDGANFVAVLPHNTSYVSKIQNLFHTFFLDGSEMIFNHCQQIARARKVDTLVTSTKD